MRNWGGKPDKEINSMKNLLTQWGMQEKNQKIVYDEKKPFNLN